MARRDVVLLDLYGEPIDLETENDFALLWRGLRRLLWAVRIVRRPAGP